MAVKSGRYRHRLLWIVALAVLLAWLFRYSHVFEDNGVHLAYELEKASKRLRASGAAELVVHYETLDDPGQGYYVEITPSIEEWWQRKDVWGSYIVVSGKTSGGTSYHNRFVYVPRRLYVRKEHGGITDLTLRRDGDRISVVGIR